MRTAIYVVDVGSPSRGLAWARVRDSDIAGVEGSSDVELCAAEIADELRIGTRVALGFEAPTFLPVQEKASDLAKARVGEVRKGTSRPWSFPVGAYTAAMLIPLSAWLLREIRSRLAGTSLPGATLSASKWEQQGGLLLWEAMVSGEGHARATSAAGASLDIQDAATAAIEFAQWMSSVPRIPSAVLAEQRVNTLGTAMLWAGWSSDVEMLRADALVLWPTVSHGHAVAVLGGSKDRQPKVPAGRGPGTHRDRACPIPDCRKVFHATCGGWDAHAGSLRKHPNWHPEVPSHDERKRLFVQEFPDFFE